MKNNFSAWIVIILLATIIPAITNAQTMEEDSEVQSLGDILNTAPEKNEAGEVMTSYDMANIYYNSCINKNSLAFNEEEQDLLCACTASNMAEKLSVEEIRLLNQETRMGKEARGKMLSFCYAPCMEYVVEDKIRGDCYASKDLGDIIRGQRTICQCAADGYKKLIRDSAASIITNAVYKDPMTLDPLEDYFTQQNYIEQKNHFVRDCKYKLLYERENK